MTLAAGTKLGPYEIVAPLGAGGMGEVYRARDTRLGRDVAVKVLPEHLDTPEARERFDREARAISSLNHAHICTLHDVGHQGSTDYLVMEYLEGETLGKRIERGPLPAAELLRIAVEVADALEKAHRQGILHRDLKPGNIMLTKAGAKLMDFGLAKATGLATVPPSSSLTLSLNNPRATEPATAKGTIVGTFQYMAPEQVEGREADARSDIFAFGAVLFEMATGKRAFEGRSQASVIAAILEREPPVISQLQPMSPPALDRVVKICLSKDPDDRFQTAHDLKLQLEWIRDACSQASIPAPVAARRRISHRLSWAVAAVFAVATVISALAYIRLSHVPESAFVSQIPPPANASFALTGTTAGPPVLSPDGQRLAFSAAGSDGRQRLWVRPLNAATAQPLEGTDGATYPFWSPDSRYVGFFANGKLNRIDASGGPSLGLCEATLGRGGSWGQDGTILFTPTTTSPIFRVPASGGTPQPVTKLDPSGKYRSHRWPQSLPDGKHFLFFAQALAETGAIYAASFDGGEPKLLLPNDSNAIYIPPGYLLFVRQGTLMAQQFDASKLQLAGDAVPLAEHVEVNVNVNRGIFSVSENGILTYEVGSAEFGADRLTWFDRGGKEIQETGTLDYYVDPNISPDGRKLAIATAAAPGGYNLSIWVFDLARGIRTRLTFPPGSDRRPAWSPDGKSIAFESDRNGLLHLYQNASDGTGTTSALVVDDARENDPLFSRDGRYLLFIRQATQANSHIEVWGMPLFGDRKAFSVLQSQFDVFQPALSPNGKWLAYVSNESGRYEVYVMPFLHGTGRWEISTAGGSMPRWRQDGRELFYLSADHKIMSAEIAEQGSSVVIGKVQAWFQANPISSTGWQYDVAGDGKRVVVAKIGTQQLSGPLTLVVNWPVLLKK